MADTQVKVSDETKPTPQATGDQTKGAAVTPTAIKAGGKDYASVDELVRAYESANTEIGRWTQQHGDLKKQYEDANGLAKQWNDWWKTVQPLWGDDVETLLRRKLSGHDGMAGQPQPGAATQPVQPQQGQPGATGWEGFELLRPEEQATRLSQAIEGRLTQGWNQQLQKLNQAWLQHLGGREQWYQQYLTNYMGLMRKALEQKLQNPNFNVDAVMEQAAKAMGGQIDPIELGQKLLTAAGMTAQLEQAKTEAYNQGKKDYETELANKKIETAPVGGVAAPIYKVPGATGTKPGLASMREKAAENIVKRFGPAWFAKE